MALQTNTVNLNAPGLDKLDNAESTLVLGLTVLEVVVVVVELGSWVGCGGHAEGNGQVLLADHAEEDIVAVGAVFVKGFKFVSTFGFNLSSNHIQLTLVDNIPVRALSLVPSHNGLDVILHYTHQRRVVIDLINPIGKL